LRGKIQEDYWKKILKEVLKREDIGRGIRFFVKNFERKEKA